MLSDEEKQSIESLKNIAIYIGDNYTFSQQGIRNLRENLRIVLPAIEKQSKEIEELKAISEYREKIIKGLGLKTLPKTITSFRELIENNDKKWEDKIKAKIEELEKQDRKNRMSHNYLVIPVLQSLLEKE